MYYTDLYFIQVTFSSQQSESQLLVFGMKKKQNVDENNISDNLDLSTNVSKTDLEILQKTFLQSLLQLKKDFLPHGPPTRKLKL